MNPQPVAKQQAREAQYQTWDRLVDSPRFQEYLAERGLSIRSLLPNLPADREAEQAAFGAMLGPGTATMRYGGVADVAVVDVGLERLRPSQLQYKNLHAPILRAIAAVRQQQRLGKPIAVDVYTVGSQLRHTKALDTCGGAVPPAYLSALVETCASPVNIHAYIDAVHLVARLKSLYELGELLQQGVLAAEALPEHLVAVVKNAADAIEEKVAPNLKEIFEKGK